MWEPFGKRTLKYGYQIDGTRIAFWGTKARAIAAVRAIGWREKDLTSVWTRFQRGYAIADSRFGLMSRTGYESLLSDRTATITQD